MIQLQGAGKRFGHKLLFEDCDWLITPRERTGLVGGNGTGKSTLLKILCGMETLDYGSLSMAKGLTIGYLPQDGLSLTGRTVFAEAMSVFDQLREMEKELEALHHSLGELDPASAEYAAAADRAHDIDSEFRNRDGYAIEAQVGTVLDGLGFRKEDWERRTEEFSGGWQMRLALAKLLLEKPGLLLLDEPTNHLDLEARNWLESYLTNYPGAYLLISHDRYFLDVTVNRTVEIWNKRVQFYSGNYDKYLVQKTERRDQLTAAYRNQRERIEQLEAFINRFRAQATKAKQVQSRIKELDKIERIEIPPEEQTIHFKFPQPKPSGRIVAEFKGVSKSYGQKFVFGDADFVIERGDRVSLVGVNGAGKSTMIKLMAGAEPLTSGSYTLGHNVIPDYFAQDQYKELDTDARLLDDLSASAPRHSQTQLRSSAGMLSVQRGRRIQEDRRAVGRRAQSLRAGADASGAVEFPAARRAHQSPGYARQRRAAGSAQGVQRHGGVRVTRPLLHRQPGDARVRNSRRPRACVSRATTKTTCGARLEVRRRCWRRLRRQ